MCGSNLDLLFTDKEDESYANFANKFFPVTFGHQSGSISRILPRSVSTAKLLLVEESTEPTGEAMDMTFSPMT